MEIRLTKLEILNGIKTLPTDYLNITPVVDKNKTDIYIQFKYGDNIFKEHLGTPTFNDVLDLQVRYLMKSAFTAGIKQGREEQKIEIQRAIGSDILTRTLK